jgi:hypothetical protein
MEKSDTHFATALMPEHILHRWQILKTGLSLFTAALLITPTLAQAEPLEDFKASYLLEKYENVVGISTYELSQRAGETHFSMRSKVSGFIALFRDDRIEEDSWLKQKDGALQLQRYSYHQYGSKDNRNTELSIHWSDDNATGTASGSHKGKPVNINVTRGVRDALSFQLSLMQNMSNHGSLNFDVLNKDELTHYSFKRTGKENLKIHDHTVDTTIVERQQDDRTTRLWLANKFQYTPVKIELLKKGKTDSLMLIDQLSLSGKRVL